MSDFEKATEYTKACLESVNQLTQQVRRTTQLNDKFEQLAKDLDKAANQAIALSQSNEREQKQNQGADRQSIQAFYDSTKGGIEKLDKECREKKEAFIGLKNNLERKAINSKSLMKSPTSQQSATAERDEIRTEDLVAEMESVEKLFEMMNKQNEVKEQPKTTSNSYDNNLSKINGMLSRGGTMGEEGRLTERKQSLPPQFMNAKMILDKGLIFLGSSGLVIAVQLLNNVMVTLEQQLFIGEADNDEVVGLFKSLVDEILKKVNTNKSIMSLRLSMNPVEMSDLAVEWLAKHKLLKSLIMIHKKLNK